MDSVALAAADHDYLWHPCTQQREWEQELPVVIARGEGTMLIDEHGNEYIDGISSLCCNIHGHRHSKIDAAIKEQLERVAHTTLHGLSHPGAIELAKRIIEISPDGLTRVFYSDSAAGATEAALEMATQYWRNSGESQRSVVLARTR